MSAKGTAGIRMLPLTSDDIARMTHRLDLAAYSLLAIVLHEESNDA